MAFGGHLRGSTRHAPGLSDIEHDIDDECRSGGVSGAYPDLGARDRERAIADLAARQHGVVARSQLLALGFGRGAIAHRVDSRRLHPVHRGVYAVGRSALNRRGVWLAAVLACGGGAALSHWSAGALWGLIRPRGPTHVSRTAQRGRGPAGVALHRRRDLPGTDRCIRNGIAVTSVPRTLLDLAAVGGESTLARAVEEADRLGLLDLGALVELRRRCLGQAGTRRLEDVSPICARPLRPARSWSYGSPSSATARDCRRPRET